MPTAEEFDEAIQALRGLQASELLRDFHRCMSAGWLTGGSERAIDFQEWIVQHWDGESPGSDGFGTSPEEVDCLHRELAALEEIVERYKELLAANEVLISQQAQLIKVMNVTLMQFSLPRIIPTEAQVS